MAFFNSRKLWLIPGNFRVHFGKFIFYLWKHCPLSLSMHCIANAHSIRLVQQASAQYAVKVQRSLAPLSWFPGSRKPTAHVHQCCRFQSYAKSRRLHEEPKTACHRQWNLQAKFTLREPHSWDPRQRPPTDHVVTFDFNTVFAIWNELQDVFACPWNPSYSHSAEQHMRGGEGISIIPLVSVPQTQSSMVGFNMRQCHTVTSPASLILWRGKNILEMEQSCFIQ